jgi:hypothetical protein
VSIAPAPPCLPLEAPPSCEGKPTCAVRAKVTSQRGGELRGEEVCAWVSQFHQEARRHKFYSEYLKLCYPSRVYRALQLISWQASTSTTGITLSVIRHAHTPFIAPALGPSLLFLSLQPHPAGTAISGDSQLMVPQRRRDTAARWPRHTVGGSHRGRWRTCAADVIMADMLPPACSGCAPGASSAVAGSFRGPSGQGCPSLHHAQSV